MHYILLIHGILAIWISIDTYKRKVNLIPWTIGTIFLGPITLPYYIATRPLKDSQSPGCGKTQTLIKVLAVFWALMLAVVGIWGGKTATNIIKEEPLEYRLAVISTKGYVREGDAIVTRFRSLLDQLSQNYIEEPQQIANMSVIVRDKLKAYGVNESLLSIMDGLNQIIWPQDSKKRRYSEYAFAYVGLRNGGLTHTEAIERVQATVNGY
ncbi:MAG: hypothetical protein ACMUIM_10235 [bacterium]